MTTKIPPFKLVPEPLSPEAADLPKFKWAGRDPDGREIGPPHKLGGEPDFLQASSQSSPFDQSALSTPG
jgi:hypothetical protein